MKAWLVKIASNKCRDYLKSAARRSVPAPQETLELMTDAASVTEETVLEKDTEKRLEDFCKNLKEPYRSIAIAYFCDHMNCSGNIKNDGKKSQNDPDPDLQIKGNDQKIVEGGIWMKNMEHLPPDKMNALKFGLLSGAETISALEHIGECEQCAEAFAESYSGRDLLELSPGFKQAVFSTIDKKERGVGIKEAKAADGKRELFRYSFRVSIAACITLLLFFSGTMDYGINLSRSIRADLTEVNVITENLRGFSDKLIHFEVTKYIKEEL